MLAGGEGRGWPREEPLGSPTWVCDRGLALCPGTRLLLALHRGWHLGLGNPGVPQAQTTQAVLVDQQPPPPWELVSNAASQAHPDALSQNRYFNKAPRGVMCL